MSCCSERIDSRRIDAMRNHPSFVSGPGVERVPMKFQGWHMLFPALFLAVVTAVLLGGCGRKTESHGEDASPVAVSTLTLAPTTLPRTVEGVGSLRSAREAELASKVMGSVIEIRKRAGDQVRQGEVVIVIDSEDVIGQIAQAEGALAQARAAATLAKTNLDRFEKLLSRGSASQLEYDQAKYQYETTQGAVVQAEGAVAAARSYQRYAEIPAPFDGRVVDRLSDVGDLTAPGKPLMRIEDSRTLRLYASLEAEQAAVAVRGTPVDVVIPSLGEERTFLGRVTEVVPAADPATHSFLVKVDLEPDPVLRSGLFGRARFTTGERQAIVVPRSALRTRGGMTGVFVVESGRTAFRLVTIADSASDPVEVLSGLAVGDILIPSPPPTLEVDVPVEVQS